MKIKLAAFVLLVAASALAFDVPVKWPDGRIRDGFPQRIGAVQNPTPATCAAAGYIAATPAEVEAQESADAQAAADAQAEALAQSFLPAQFATGIAVTNADGHWVKFVPAGTGVVSEAIAIQISHSPPDPETAAQMEAEGLALHESKKSASRAKIAQAKSQAAAANSVPALRAAVAKIIEALEE